MNVRTEEWLPKPTHVAYPIIYKVINLFVSVPLTCISTLCSLGVFPLFTPLWTPSGFPASRISHWDLINSNKSNSHYIYILSNLSQPNGHSRKCIPIWTPLLAFLRNVKQETDRRVTEIYTSYFSVHHYLHSSKRAGKNEHTFGLFVMQVWLLAMWNSHHHPSKMILTTTLK